MKKVQLIILLIGLSFGVIAQVKSPTITANIADQKELSDRTFTFNIGTAIPYFYNGSADTLLQVGFPYNALYMDETFPIELFASKGYFPDQVQLRWEIANNASLIQQFDIFRKKVTENDSVWVDNVDASARKWEDFYAEANEIYQYTVVAVGIPGQQTEKYTKLTGIGFRSPLATVTGRVSFEGGNGVKDVVISATTEDAVPAKSVIFSDTSYIKINQELNADFSSGFTFQSYLKFNSTGDAGIFRKFGNFDIKYINGKFRFKVGSENLDLPYSVPTDKFIHFSAVYTGDSAKIFIPTKIINNGGFLIDSVLQVSIPITNSLTANTNNILIGKSGTDSFDGVMDEIRIWKKALTKEEIIRDYNRYISGKEEGIFAYLRMNEGFGENVYDISKTGSLFNENHGFFVGANVSWSNNIPDKAQLGHRGITDEEGNYIIAGIPFLTDGSAYRFTPMLAPHEFNPSYKLLFLSEDAVVHNNINFTDISSFALTGRIVYRNTNKGVKGVNVLVDGEPVFGPNNRPEQTDEEGEFNIQVPIGFHYVNFEKNGHQFDKGGRWPYEESNPDSIVRHNFIANKALAELAIDTTLITVIGRVIGGTGSNEIPMGFGQSENNIGKATLTLDHSSANSELVFDNIGDALGRDTINYEFVTLKNPNPSTEVFSYFSERDDIFTYIYTDPASGEFIAKLIPEKFSKVEIAVDNDTDDNVKNFLSGRVIDLSTNPSLKKEYLYDEDGQLLDSLEYHIKLNYIYQTPPQISVTNTNDTVLFYGEKEISFTNPVDGTTDNIVVSDHFRYPIFNMMQTYNPKISVFESYKNYDTDAESFQAIKYADIKIINDLAIKNQVKTYQLTPEMNGQVIDTFMVGIPNITKSVGDATSFTKTLQINVEVDGNTFPFLVKGELYRAYIQGQRPKGNNFYTEGPQVPEIILRDPPGSHSSAFIEQGSSYSVSSGYSTNFDNSAGFGMQILLGVEVSAGGGLAGPVIKTDNKNSGETGLSFSTTVNNSGQYVQTYEFTERVETSSDPGVVGSMGDIYIGKSYNYFYGETDNLTILPKSLADATGVIALDTMELEGSTYTLGIVEGFIMNPDNSDTYFKYTQAHILNKLLPELESRRNNLFLSSKRSDGTLKYTVELDNPLDIRYAIAHTYDVITTPTDTLVNAYYKMSDTDSILTYSFRPEQKTVQDLNNIENDTIFEIDSIRYYNAQIGIWIDAIRINEAEKARAIEENVLEQNVSFDGAVGSVSRTQVQTISYNKEESRSKNLNFTAKGSLGFKFNGVGVIATGNLAVTHSMGISVGEGFSQTMKYGYTLSDGDVGDYYSINVFRRPDNGVYNADQLEETKMELPDGFEFGILGALGAGVGAGAGAATLFVGQLGAYFTASSTAGAAGGGALIGTATAMAIGAGVGYIPYVSFQDEVQEIGERFSPGDIRVSSFDISSPIFSTLGGQTMCPFQDLEHTFFYRNDQGDSIVLHKPTLQREKPEITAEPAEVHNVPITDKAFFNIKLANNTESGDDQWYSVRVDEKTNPNGAAVKIDGATASKTILVPANTTVTKVLSISPTDNSILNYDSIGIVIHSTCQFDPTDFIPDISDTVFISASFQPSCTNVEVLEPLDNWVVNVRDNDTMSIRLGGYNLAYQSFESFRFEYKPSSGNFWSPVKYFVNDPALQNKDEIPDTIYINGSSSVSFPWDMTNLRDRSYDIRAVSVCSDGSENESIILTGVLDGQRPQVFGTPQPADGILNLEDDLSIQFNEPIEGGLITSSNYTIRGTRNNSDLKHEAFISLDGVSEYATVPEGISLTDKSFMIEFWLRPEVYKNAVIFSQGNDPTNSLEIGLNGSNETYFKIGNVNISVPFEFSPTIPPETWQHLGYVYDFENGDIFIYQNDKIIHESRSVSVSYKNSGKIYIGKSSVSNDNHFQGDIHELRIWSKFITDNIFYENQYKTLSGNEVGLYGYWPIDEAFGDLALDKAASRHMEVYATWEAYPGGFSWDFNGNNFIEMFTGHFAIIPEMDYTIEFWFKDDNPIDTITLFSNQKGDGMEGDNLMEKTLSISATPDGKIWVNSKGNRFEAVSANYFDNKWHHFALVLRRMGNVTSFIDGEPQNSTENTVLGGIAGAKMYLGVRKWNNIEGEGEDQYFDGKMDEFRLWNLAKTQTQIQIDMNSKIYGDEMGLWVYHPFEGYFTDYAGSVSQIETLENFDDDNNVRDGIPNIENAFTTDAPNIKNVRPVENLAFQDITSEDKIIFVPKSSSPYPDLEKNIIEITVQDIEDKYGNRMASPATWTAYVHRNQVRWEDERRIFTKELYKPLSFVSSIKNTGGQQVGFTLTNLPPWLTAEPSSGEINPESTVAITFHINPALNIGEYNEDIILHTENGFDEKLPITVRVYKQAPNWVVNPSKYEGSMNFVGRVRIEEVLSTDVFDKVAAFVNDSIRGVSNIRYVKNFDSYMVFLTVYGDSLDNANQSNIQFRIWDASAGQILDQISPDTIGFKLEEIVGTTRFPITFEATGLYRQYLPLSKGWNWLSFNKVPSNTSVDNFMSALEPNLNDQIKTLGAYANFTTTGWDFGNLTNIDHKWMYQVKISNPDTIIYSGEEIIPEDNPIPLRSGWNHIGYLPDLAMDVNDALRLFNRQEGDVIKSQFAFSMYDNRAGWLGNLTVMQPNFGYKFKVQKNDSLKYPNSTVFKGVKIPQYTSPPNGWNSNPTAFDSNMSLIAKLNVGNNQNININSEMVLGAFVENECRGFVSPITNAGIGYEPFFLNVSGSSNGQTVKFMVYDGATGLTYNVSEIKPFVSDAVYGSTTEPEVLTITHLSTGIGEYNKNEFLRCYPNPFSGQINIEFTGINDKLTIDVLNATGSLVKRIYNAYPGGGTNKLIWDGNNQNGVNVSSGIYYIRSISGNSVQTIKISKTR